MKSVYRFAAVAAATLASAKPMPQVSNASSVADPVAAAALESALAAQGGQNVGAAEVAGGFASSQVVGGVSAVGSAGQPFVTQVSLDQSQLLCGGAGINSAFSGFQQNFVPPTVLFQGIDQVALANVLPFFGGNNAFFGAAGNVFNNGLFNNGFANAGLLSVNSLSAIPGAFIDPTLGLQVVEVLQTGIGTIGVAPIVQGLAVSSGFPVISNGQLIQVVSLDQAIAQGLGINQLATPILVNGILQQVFPIDQSLLLAAGGLLGGLPLVSGVNIAALPFNVASNSLWNFGLNTGSVGVLSSGVANVLPLTIGNPFFVQSSSFAGAGFNNAAFSSLAVANSFSPVFLLADPAFGAVNFANLAVNNIANNIVLGGGIGGFGGIGAGIPGVFKN